MIKKLKCGICSGTGQSGNWSENGKKVVIEDCGYCKGKGFREIDVKDKRVVSKGKTLDLPYSA